MGLSLSKGDYRIIHIRFYFTRNALLDTITMVTIANQCFVSLTNVDRWHAVIGFSMPHPRSQQIRFVTFGGLGGSASDAKRSLSATAYPGGNATWPNGVAKEMSRSEQLVIAG